jgi:hypothetical protein
MMSLDQAFERRALEQRTLGSDVWPDDMLPILRGPSSTFGCDLAAGSGRLSPVRLVDVHAQRSLAQAREIRAWSLGEMVGIWIQAIDRGYWEVDPERGSWRRSGREIPEDLLNTELV